VLGVTGTNGKTTTTHLIEAILWADARPAGRIGTVGNRLGRYELPGVHTTPESADLQAMLSDMQNRGADYAVMEVSSHALALERVAGCEYDAAVFTNLTQDHLDYHGTMEEYFQAKARLFAGLGRGGKQGKKYAVINIDNSYGQRLLDISPVPVITYSTRQPADVTAHNISVFSSGIAFRVAHADGEFQLKLQLAGLFNVYNALAAVSVGLQEGVAPEVIREALEQVSGVPGRFELVDCGQPFAVVVDYAHTPDGLETCSGQPAR
jgi:UDP-N-acetylmuramoyl-L-alanyl-D-glutamate--2,6-diaminopimelate ligase